MRGKRTFEVTEMADGRLGTGLYKWPLVCIIARRRSRRCEKTGTEVQRTKAQVPECQRTGEVIRSVKGYLYSGWPEKKTNKMNNNPPVW